MRREIFEFPAAVYISTNLDIDKVLTKEYNMTNIEMYSRLVIFICWGYYEIYS